MSQVKITLPTLPRGAVAAHGLRLEMDGAEIKEITDLSLTFPLDGLAQLHVSCYLESPFSIEGEAGVHIHTHLNEGDTLIESTNLNTNGRTFQVVRKGDQVQHMGHPYVSVGQGSCGKCGHSRKEHL